MQEGRLFFHCVILAAAFCWGTSSAEDIGSWKRDADFDLGLELGGFYHSEGDTALKGPMPGIFASAKMYDPVFFDLSARYAAGSLIYDGVSWGAEPTKQSTSDYLLEFRGLVGYDVSRTQVSAISLYSGIGFWYWDNRTSPPGYGREYRTLYFPLGFDYAYFDEGYKYGVRVEYDLPIRNQVKSMIEETDPALNDVKNLMHDGNGSRISFYIEGPISRKTSVSVEPYFRYWSFGDSETSDAGGGTMVRESASETYEFGLALALVF